MLDFVFQFNDCFCGQIPRKYPDVLMFEGHFQILIDGQIFFFDPNFAIFEFLLYAFPWIDAKDKSKDMLYNCLDTIDNPLISFLKKDNEYWIVESPWKCFDCQQYFSREEIEKAVFRLCKSINYN